MIMFTGQWTKWCVAGAMVITVAGAAGGCANRKDPSVQARRQQQAERNTQAQRLTQENRQAEIDLKRQAQADARQREADRRQAEIDRRNNAIADKKRREEEKRQARLDRERKAREDEMAFQTKGASRTPEGWNVDKAVGEPMRHGDYIGADWPTENQVRSIDNFMRLQSALGAAEDAMLLPQHFDGGALNSLGRAKLDLILAAAPVDKPAHVYLPQDDHAGARRAALKEYVKTSPYADRQLELKEGWNDSAAVPAASGLAGLKAMQHQSGAAGSGASDVRADTGATGANMGGASR